MIVAPIIWVKGACPGENPSLSVQDEGLMCLLLLSAGSVVLPKATCLPVGVEGSSAR